MYRYARAAAEDHAREPVLRACAHARLLSLHGTTLSDLR